MEYTKIITRDDYVSFLKRKGYDLKAEGVLDSVHFETIEDSVDAFLQDAFDIVYNEVADNRGAYWTRLFYDDMSQEQLSAYALEYKADLKQALVQQAIFMYDNGDSQSDSLIQKDRTHISDKALKILIQRSILRY